MPPVLKKYGQAIFASIGALAIVGIALWAKGTEYDNAWLYLFCVWLIFHTFLEVYLNNIKNKK